MIPYSLNPLGVNPVSELTDLDILRQIRDANPTSQLPSLWLDSEDPYTQWEEVYWVDEKTRVIQLDIANANVTTLINVNKLTSLQYLYCTTNQLTALDVTGLNSLTDLYCTNNQLTSIPTLTSKGNIVNYDFTYNNFTTAELDRFRAMGFTDESKLLPQNP